MKKGEIKGSVLYTVVSVMSILTVFAMTAFVLVASANRRLHNSYANYQTQFTAKSVIEKAWEQIAKNEGLLEKISQLSVGDDEGLPVSIKGIDVSMGMGEIKDAKIKCVKEGLYKFSVTVKMTGQENTVAAYYNINKETTFNSKNNFKYALVSIDSGGMDNAKLYGGTSLGVNEYNGYSTLINNCVVWSPINTNGNFKIDQTSSVKLRQNYGMYVKGDLFIGNAGTIGAVVQKGRRYRDLPYIFSKSITYQGPSVTIGDYDNPAVVMTNQIIDSGQNYENIYGDLYIYNENEVTELKDKSIKLNSFNSDVLDTGYTGGNIFSLGQINYTSTSNSIVMCNNMKVKSLNVGMSQSSFNTNGAVVADDVSFNVPGWDNELKGGLFVDPDKFTHNDGIIINGIHYGVRQQPYQKLQQVNTTPSYITIDIPQTEPADKNSIEHQVYASNRFWNLSNVVDYNNMVWVNGPWGLYPEAKKYPFEPHKFSFSPENFPGYEEGMYVMPASFTIDWAQSPNTSFWDGFTYDIKINTSFSGNQIGTDENGNEKLGDESKYIETTFSSEWTDKKNPLTAGFNFDTTNLKTDSKYSFSNYKNNVMTCELKWCTGLKLTYDVGKPDQVELNGFTYDKVLHNQIVVNSITLGADFYKEATFYTPTATTELYAPLTKFTESNITYLRAVNDVAFENNGNVIRIQDPDKTITLLKGVDTNTGRTLLKIENSKDSSEQYFDYETDSDYAEFLRAVVRAVSFPESMTKENVIMKKDAGGNVTSGIVDNSFLTRDESDSKSLIESMAEQEVADAFKNIDKTTSIVYDGSSNLYPDEVTESCTFSGKLSKCITIAPKEDIYIKLDKFMTDNNYSNSATFITVKDMHDGKKVNVNFLIPDGSYAYIYGNILTEYYSKNSIQLNPSPTNLEMIPGIYFYVQGTYNDAIANCNEISFEHHHVSGYIVAPHGKLSLNSENENPAKIFSDSSGSIGSWKNSVLGAVICRQIQFSNMRNFYYIDPSAADSGRIKNEAITNYKSKLLYYQAY